MYINKFVFQLSSRFCKNACWIVGNFDLNMSFVFYFFWCSCCIIHLRLFSIQINFFFIQKSFIIFLEFRHVDGVKKTRGEQYEGRTIPGLKRKKPKIKRTIWGANNTRGEQYEDHDCKLCLKYMKPIIFDVARNFKLC